MSLMSIPGGTLLHLKPVYMQDYRNNEKKTIKNGRQSTIFYFISAKFVTGYTSVIPYLLFYNHGPAISLFLRYVNITTLLKFKMVPDAYFKIVLFID